MPPSRNAMQSRKRRQERIRQERHLRRREEGAPPEAPSVRPSAFERERLLRLLARLRKAHPGEDLDDAAFLTRLQAMPPNQLLASLPEDPVEEAQELAFQAMEADTVEEAQELAQAALDKDPDCLDARCLMGSLEARDLAGAARALAAALAAEEQRLGPAHVEQMALSCETAVELRPYLRALSGLARMLEELERPGEAIPHYQRLLRLSPSDPMGHREALVRAYLAADRLKELHRFLKEHLKSDLSAIFAWADVLERHKSGALAGAAQALQRARSINPYVEDFLTGRRRLPKQLPTTYEEGSPEAAVVALDCIGRAWTEDRQAMAWLLRGGRELNG